MRHFCLPIAVTVVANVPVASKVVVVVEYKEGGGGGVAIVLVEEPFCRDMNEESIKSVSEIVHTHSHILYTLYTI